MGIPISLDPRWTAANCIKRIWCGIVGHKWKFTLNFVEGPDDDNNYRGSSHYSGECSRCHERDLFRGPYSSSTPEK